MTDVAPVLFVHAHPDDETLTTGIAMAHLVSAGVPVHLLTSTLGEEGEVIPPELAHLDSAHDDALGPHRLGELRGAMAELGVTHELLGADEARGRLSRWRDSGMAGTPTAANPAAYVNASLDEAAGLVADVIRRLRPRAVVTYDAEGGYRHPDHIQTHRVTRAAVASLPEGERPSLYAVVTPMSWAREDRAWLAEHLPPDSGWALPPVDGEYPPGVVPDEVVTHAVERPDLAPRQADALRHHRTQVTVRGDTYALSNDIAARLSGREGFVRIDPVTGLPMASGEDGGYAATEDFVPRRRAEGEGPA
ncbi:N-acetyl-1-D-myo-inositol-2-amino-2-deoxy-alpha-D-glucopyranoside deacetylase [Knoellia koreensis]|uniref:N-acetyl-1-D-myo-inositol-2-amino-2-deoxy-alpha-D-glucopyranoside deacetylase n=1 Tax=Knoellia koreensis TaxID=2730921 RepID=A0A849HEU9_9MICO|nr:N-acetyl-1-D-myo-inositol-2-amino-2-deoxy-alpha-D-glucopyranoside deacetylase [Knoellia sp. DB2414S]